MKVTYKQLNNEELVEAFKQIKKTPLPVKAAYRFGKIGEKLDGIVSEFQDRYVAFLKQNAKKDENGNPVLKKKEDGTVIGFVIQDELIEETNKTYEQMLSQEVDLGVLPVEAEMLKEAKISPDTIMALEPFITGLDA